MSKPFSILYLDDEEQNLVSFQALFRRQYNVFTTSSAHEAVDILNNHDIQVIFSDQKMPDVSGVEFFETILPDFPHPVRILLTGYADIEAVIDAINKGQVYRYVAKPWDANELAVCVENALEKYRREQELLRKSNDLEQSNATLEQFVFSASQQLRNPTEQIIKAVEEIERIITDAEAGKALEAIRIQTARLQGFGEQITQYYSNSKAAAENVSVNLEELVQRVIQQIPTNLTAAKWSIKTEFNLNGPFLSDPSRLLIVLQNLLNNAVQFSDPSKSSNDIQFTIIQNAEKAIFRIADQGVGIEPGRMEQLFNLQLGQDKMAAGGINMYLTKSVVDKMYGKISATSKPGEGTLITFELPNIQQ
jgi:light-regulated signal transduction histidine kinase (bacteriophytochrome)